MAAKACTQIHSVKIYLEATHYHMSNLDRLLANDSELATRVSSAIMEVF